MGTTIEVPKTDEEKQAILTKVASMLALVFYEDLPGGEGEEMSLVYSTRYLKESESSKEYSGVLFNLIWKQ